MRWVAVFTACAVFLAIPAKADVRQSDRDNVLRSLPADKILQRRSSCAAGDIPAWLARLRGAGFQTLSTGAYCVTVLTRAGRDGTLRYVTLKNGETTPAIAFDTGFVKAYLKREALPADLPSMASLLPIADRCLDQKEPNARLCGLAGQVLGTRAAHGELVPVS